VVAWDALNTQKETVTAVIRKRGDYVGVLKGNHHDFYRDVKAYFDEATLRGLKKRGESCLKTVDKEQSGADVREYYLTDGINWLSGRKEQAGLKSIGCVRRTLEKPNRERLEETRYFIAGIRGCPTLCTLG
jgi:hypothetical protein